jgi:hypothetical protein
MNSRTHIGDLSFTWDANKNKTSESITGVMSGYGFTSAGTTYDNEDRLTGFSRAATSGPALLSQSWNITTLSANLRPSGSTSAMNLNWDSDNKLRSTASQVSAR